MNDTTQSPAPEIPGKDEPKPERASGEAVASAAIVTLVVAGIVGLSIWYLARPQPLIIQGEADATRIDIAARIDGRVGQRPVERGENVEKGRLLYEIDNPELVAKWRQAAGRRRRRQGPARQHPRRDAGRDDRPAQGGRRGGGGEFHPRPAHLRPHQGARRQRQRAVAAARRSDEFARSRQAAAGPGEARL